MTLAVSAIEQVFHKIDLLDLSWDYFLVFAFLAVIIPWRGVVRVRKLLEQPAFTSAERMSLYAATIAAQWVGAGFLWWRGWARGYQPADWGVGVPDPASAISAAAVLLALVCEIQVLSVRRLAQLPAERHGRMGNLIRKLMPESGAESLVFAGLALTAGICEEYIYRGFALTVIERAAGGYAAAGIIGSSLLFSVAHLYQGRRGVVSTFVLGGVFGISRTVTGSLLPAVVAHACVDLLAGLWAARKLRALASSTKS